MRMRTVYIAHPIGGDVKANTAKVLAIFKTVFEQEITVVPFAPYIPYVMCLDDEQPDVRTRAISHNLHLLSLDFVDEVRLYGDRISSGMKEEIDYALRFKVAIRPMTPGTIRAFQEMYPDNASLI